MRHLVVALALALSLVACDGGASDKSLNEARKELVDEVGGAPKAQVDKAQEMLDQAARDMANKNAAAIDEATAE